MPLRWLGVAKNERPQTLGREGLQDMGIIESIDRAAGDGRPIDLPLVGGTDSMRGPAPSLS